MLGVVGHLQEGSLRERFQKLKLKQIKNEKSGNKIFAWGTFAEWEDYSGLDKKTKRQKDKKTKRRKEEKTKRRKGFRRLKLCFGKSRVVVAVLRYRRISVATPNLPWRQTRTLIFKTSQELRMLSSVTLNCQVTMQLP